MKVTKDTKVRMTLRKQEFRLRKYMYEAFFSKSQEIAEIRRKKKKQVLNDNSKISSRGTRDCQIVTWVMLDQPRMLLRETSYGKQKSKHHVNISTSTLLSIGLLLSPA